MTLAMKAAWSGKIFSNGWNDALGGSQNVNEPATGAVLGSTGLANATDVDRAASSAFLVRKAWADTPFDQRAAI
jgi:benzaldehyde dehydrogenase (NAD)